MITFEKYLEIATSTADIAIVPTRLFSDVKKRKFPDKVIQMPSPDTKLKVVKSITRNTMETFEQYLEGWKSQGYDNSSNKIQVGTKFFAINDERKINPYEVVTTSGPERTYLYGPDSWTSLVIKQMYPNGKSPLIVIYKEKSPTQPGERYNDKWHSSDGVEYVPDESK